MTGDNTGPRPICPCRRNAVSSIGQADVGPTPVGQILTREIPETRPARRTRGAVAFALPSIALALLPKCPMCIAAWVAIGGGLGVSLSTAAHLRTALVWACWSVLVLLAARVAMRLASKSAVKRSTFKTSTIIDFATVIWPQLAD
jgi:hypothetical protein